KASTRSGSSARILSVRKVVKPPTRARSRAASGRRAVPGTPTTRAPAPRLKAISAVSAVRQTMRWGESTPVWPYIGRGSAGVRGVGLQHVGEVAQHQPAGEGLHQRARSLEPDAARAHALGEAQVAGPHLRHGGDVGVDDQIDLEARVAHADVV